MSDQDRISPYNIKKTSDEIKEKYQSGDYKLIQNQFLKFNITRTVWQTVRRITNQILGVKGFAEVRVLCMSAQGFTVSFSYMFSIVFFNEI